jgi:hypothetical protein
MRFVSLRPPGDTPPGGMPIRLRRGASLGLLTLLLASAGALVGARQTPAPPAADSRAFTLSSHFEKGQTWRYQTTGTMTLDFKSEDAAKVSPGFSLGMEISVRYTVLQTQPNGTAVLSVLTEGGRLVNPPDPAITLPKDPDNYPRTATLDKQARILALKDPSIRNAGPLSGLFGQPSDLFVPLHFLPLPEKAIRVGDSWSVRYPSPNTPPAAKSDRAGSAQNPTEAGDPNAIQSRMTLLGTQMLNGQETLQIKQELTIPFTALIDAAGKATTDPKKSTGRVETRLTFTQTVNALPADGQVLRSQGEIGGWIRFVGDIVKTLPSDTMQIAGKLDAVLLPGAAPEAPKTK